MPRRRYLGRQAVDLGGIEDGLGRLQRRLPALVGDRDVRQRVDQLPREVGLRAFHQRRHHDREADAGGDAGHGNQRLAHAEAHMRQRDVDDEVHGPSRLRSTARTRWPSRKVSGGWATTRSPSARPERISTLRAPRMPTSTCRTPHAIALDDEHPRALHGIGRHQQGVGLLARDDVGLDAHADVQRRIVGQRDADAVGLGDRIAHRRDLVHLALQPPAREGIGAQQHGLADRHPRDVLLVDLGHHLQRLRRADPEQDLALLDDLADLAVAPQHHALPSARRWCSRRASPSAPR